MQTSVKVTYLGKRKNPTEPILPTDKPEDLYEVQSSETKRTRSVHVDNDRKAWVYFLDDGSNCNMRVPWPARLDRDPTDTPVEIQCCTVNPSLLKTAGTRELLDTIGSQVVFSDGTSRRAGYPVTYDRTTDETERFRALALRRERRPTAKIARESATLTIQEAARFCGCTEKTIRNRLNKLNQDGTPMLAGVIGKNRLTRIPRASLEPFRK